jgi:hypothetical protein
MDTNNIKKERNIDNEIVAFVPPSLRSRQVWNVADLAEKIMLVSVDEESSRHTVRL